MLTVLSVTILTSKMVYAQTNIDTLWSLLKTAQPIQERSAVWEAAAKPGIKETCILGDCSNGYGVSIANDRAVGGRYQYEGGFLNAKHHGVGIARNAIGYTRVCNYDNGKETGAYLLDNNGLIELHNVKGFQKATKEFGFALTVVEKHQANSFEKFAPCKCLTRATHIEVEEYQQPIELTDEFKNYKGTGYRTETRRVEYPGLRNTCKNTVYVKAIASEGGYYYDRSLVVLPGNSIMKRPFNSTYTPGKEDLQYLGQYEAVPVLK